MADERREQSEKETVEREAEERERSPDQPDPNEPWAKASSGDAEAFVSERAGERPRDRRDGDAD